MQIDPAALETSVPGIYASGDPATRMQGASLAAATGMDAAARIHVAIEMDA